MAIGWRSASRRTRAVWSPAGLARVGRPRRGIDDDRLAGAHGLAQEADAAVADDEPGRGDAAGAAPPAAGSAPRRGGAGSTRGVADLGEAGEASSAAAASAAADQLVEAVDEGADGDQDHRSGPEASTARGKASSFSGHWTMNRSANG